MTYDECLLTPHHFTHEGVCYVGSNAYIGITSPTGNGHSTFHVGVPEPDISPLFALGLALLAVKLWQHRHG